MNLSGPKNMVPFYDSQVRELLLSCLLSLFPSTTHLTLEDQETVAIEKRKKKKSEGKREEIDHILFLKIGCQSAASFS